MARKGLTKDEFKAAMEKRRSAYLDNPEMYGFFSDIYDYIIEGAAGYQKKKQAAAAAAADIGTMDLSDEPTLIRRLEETYKKYKDQGIGSRGMVERPSVAERGDQLGLARLSSGDLSRPVENFQSVPRKKTFDLTGSQSTDDLDASAGAPTSSLPKPTPSAAPKKQTAPATKAARTGDKDAPVEDMAGVRQSISDVRPISRPSDVEDLDESAASIESQMDSLMGASEPADPMELEAAAGQTFRTQREMDEEIAAREPFGESAGRLAIQNFMERNFGFTPTVTYDDDSDPDLNP